MDIDTAGLPIEFDIHDSITQAYVGTLEFSSWSFNDPVFGAGSFSGELSVLPYQKEFLKEITTPWGMQFIRDMAKRICGADQFLRDRGSGEEAP